MIAKQTQLFLLKYGFLLIIMFIARIFFPDLEPKASLSDLDWDNRYVGRASSSSLRAMIWGFFFLFFASHFVMYRMRKVENKIFTKKLIVILSLCSVAIISALWSTYFAISLRRSLFLFMFCSSVGLSFFYAVKYGTIERSIVLASLFTIGMILVSIAMGVAFTGGNALAGHVHNKNTLGAILMTLIALNLLYRYESPRYWFLNYKTLCVVLGIFLILSASKTNIAILTLVMLLFALNVHILRNAVSCLFLFLCGVFIWMPLSLYISGEYTVFSDFVSEDFLTGRGYIWSAIYYDLMVFEKLTLGYGFGSYFGVPVLPYYFDDTFSFLRFINTAHSGYVELLIQFGLLMSTVIAAIIFYLIRMMKYKKQLILVCIPILQNISESTLLQPSAVMTLLFIVLVLYQTLPRNQNLSKHEN